MYWTYVTVPLYASSALMHSIGFFLLYKVEFRPENQRLILMHLSAAEFFQSVITAVEHTLYFLVKEIERVRRYSIQTNFSVGILLKFILIHLIVDRTLDVYLHLRYPIIVTKRNVRIILCTFWLLAIVTGTIVLSLEIFYIHNSKLLVLNVLLVVYIIVDGLVVTCSVSSFIYLF